VPGFENGVIAGNSKLSRTASGVWVECNDGTDNFGMYNHAGDPNSNVAADTGSYCLDTSSGGGMWVKTTDTVNTGWVQLLDSSSGSGMWVWESTTTVSNDATIDFTGLTGSGVKFAFYNLLPATDNVELQMVVSNDNGSTWESTDSQWNWLGSHSNGSTVSDGNRSGTYWGLATGSGTVGNAAGEYGCAGWIEVYGLNDASNPAYAVYRTTGHRATDGACFNIVGSATSTEYSNGGAHLDIDALRFLFSAGNATSGTIAKYTLTTS